MLPTENQRSASFATALKRASRACLLAALLAAPACTATSPAVVARPDRMVSLPAGFAAVGDETEAASGLPRRIRQVELDYELVLVPAGPFTITSYDTLTGARLTRSDSTDAFYIGVTPVTNAQYHRYRPAHESAPGDSDPLNAETAPVLDIYWEQARDFCAWAGMTLPGETEWLKAAYLPRPGAAGRRPGPVEYFIPRPPADYPEWCADSATYCLLPRGAADTAAEARPPVVRAGLESGFGLFTSLARAAGLLGQTVAAGTPVGWASLGYAVLQSFPDWFVATRAALPVRRETGGESQAPIDSSGTVTAHPPP